MSSTILFFSISKVQCTYFYHFIPPKFRFMCGPSKEITSKIKMPRDPHWIRTRTSILFVKHSYAYNCGDPRRPFIMHFMCFFFYKETIHFVKNVCKFLYLLEPFFSVYQHRAKRLLYVWCVSLFCRNNYSYKTFLFSQ
jgi:hypothetical protein